MAKKKTDDAASQEATQAAEEQEHAGNGQERADTGSPGDIEEIVGVPDEDTTLEVTFKSYPSRPYDHKDLGLEDDQLTDLYRNMLLQRRFEERSAQMYGKQKIAGFLHLYIGQEAVSTAAATALEIGLDSVITAYRDHGIGLALGMTAKEGMAELFGKATGSSKGKGGSMHFFKKEVGMMGGHGIVGGHIPVGVGLGFAHKYKEDGGVAVIFFGDGAVGQGAFHEAMNLAALYELPVVFVIENNMYAMGTAVERAFAEADLYKNAVAYNMQGAVANGMDFFSAYDALKSSVDSAREHKPVLLEMRTYRYRGHSMSDPGKYRTKEELEEKKNEDPILRLKSYLLDKELSTNEELDAIDEEVKQDVLDAVDFAEESDFPDLDAIYEDIYPEGFDHPNLFLA